MTLDHHAYTVTEGDRWNRDEERERRERYEPIVKGGATPMNARTKHGLTYEQCSRLADAYVALMDCRAPLSAHLPPDFLGRDPLERVILAAKRLSEEEIIKIEPEAANA